MATRKKPAAGSKPDKLITDAIRMELQVEAKARDGTMTKKLRLLARKLIDRAIEGDVPAAREVLDRIEGKVPQTLGDDDTGAMIVRIIKFAEREEPETATETSVH